MTNAELLAKIKAEIERRTYGEQGFNSEEAEYGYRSCARDLLSILSTLESEKPMEQDDELNDEIKRFVAEYGYERGNDILLIAIVARHFTEWKKEQMMKEAVEGEIYGSDGSHWIETDIDENLKGKDGDKVHIIVLPKED